MMKYEEMCEEHKSLVSGRTSGRLEKITNTYYKINKNQGEY